MSNATAGGAAPGRIPKGSILTLISVDVFARVSYGLARTPLLPLYAAFLGARPMMIGVVGAAATITGIVLKLPSGAISDVVGRRPLLLFGLVIFATGPLLYLAAGSEWSLMGVRFYHGLATAIYSPVAMAAVAALAMDRKGEYLSWLSNSKIVGKLVGAFLGGLILTYAILRPESIRDALTLRTLKAAFSLKIEHPEQLAASDFHRAYLVCAGFGIAALILGLLVLRRIREPALEKKRTLREVMGRFGRGIREVASDARVLLVSGSEAVQNLTVGILEQFLPVYACTMALCSAVEAGLLYGVQVLTTIVAQPFCGRFSDRRGRRGLILAGMVLCAAPFAAIPWFTSFPALAGLAMVFGLGEAFVTACSSALVGDLCRERSLGAAMGVFGTITDAGHALGPILGGALITLFALAAPGRVNPVPYRAAFAVVAALLVLYTVFFALATRKVRTT